jgi:O-antigen/teichoic acid export membrane protein
MMVYFDRFLIGALVSVTAIAYYSTPFDIVMKVLIIPGAFVGVLFPVFSSTFMEDPQKSAKIYNSGLKIILLMLYPISLAIVTFAKEGLLFWIGSEFANHGFRVMQLLVIGVLINGVAYIPFTFIQGVGRPDVTAKLHLVEFIFYVPCVWWLVTSYGIVGAGLAWVVRSSADAIYLLYYAGVIIKDFNVFKYNKIMVILIMLLISLTISMISLPFVFKIPLFGLMLAVFIVSAWNYIMEDEDKYYIYKLVETYTK